MTKSPFKTTSDSSNIFPEKSFLISLFSEFNKKKIRYVVMRNYNDLPFSLGGSDLDILVDSKERKRVLEILGRCIKVNRGAPIGVVKQKDFIKIFLFGGNNLEWGVCLDVFFKVTYKGAASLVDEDLVFKNRRCYNSVFVAPPDDAAILGVLKELVHNGWLPEQYLGDAQKAITNNWLRIKSTFSPIGEKALSIFREICICSENMQNLKREAKKLRFAILAHAFLRNFWACLEGWRGYWWSRINRIIFPPGLMVAILGTDGSGKSTVIEAIAPVLGRATHGALYVQHLRPALLPPLARIKGKAHGVQEESVTNPHGSKSSGIPGSLFRLFYLVIDYIFGYWIKIRPHIAKKPAIVLFDRYAYDLEMDPRRFRIKLPKRLLHLAAKLAPKPDLIFCLDGEAEEIQRRKQELPLEEVERQLAFIRNFAANHPDAVLISTRGTVEETRYQVLDVLRQYCLARNSLDKLH